MFKSVEELKDALHQFGYDDSIVFENPSYADAVIGISNSGNVCYCYEKMIQSLMQEDSMDEEEAIEFIDYNTIRAIPYFSSYGPAPIVVFGDFLI